MHLPVGRGKNTAVLKHHGCVIHPAVAGLLVEGDDDRDPELMGKSLKNPGGFSGMVSAYTEASAPSSCGK